MLVVRYGDHLQIHIKGDKIHKSGTDIGHRSGKVDFIILEYSIEMQ